jgi:GntR family transcriptional repressor for pyruvate dehydrogenase complex
MLQRVQPPESTVERCTDALRKAILSGHLAAGERLPPERELSTRLGVSRLTVRAALFQLRCSGLVEVRQGSGYTVRDFRSGGGPDLIGALVHLTAEPAELATIAEELLLVRRQLAAGVLQQIAQRGSVELAGVRAAFDEFAAHASAHPDDVDGLALLDMRLIGAIVDAGAGAVMRLCLNPIAAVLAESSPLKAVLYRNPASNVAGYRALLGWLEEPVADGVMLLIAELERRDRASLQLLTGELP